MADLISPGETTDEPGCALLPGGLSTCYCTGRPGCQSPREDPADDEDDGSDYFRALDRHDAQELP